MAKKVNKNNNMVKVLIKEKSFDELIELLIVILTLIVW